MIFWWVSTIRKSSPWHLKLTAACVNRVILICQHPLQTWYSSSSSSWSTSFDITVCVDSTIRTEVSENNQLTIPKEDNIDTGCECHRTTLPSLGNMPQMQLSIRDAPKSTSTATLSTTSNHARTRRSPIYTNVGMIPSICTVCVLSFVSWVRQPS